MRRNGGGQRQEVRRHPCGSEWRSKRVLLGFQAIRVAATTASPLALIEMWQVCTVRKESVTDDEGIFWVLRPPIQLCCFA